ncbi:aminotransferase class V-fold PLP-dependent enzyme [Arthrobacter mobilis]|uniref:Aminotransferase class V-fold PLP-dependent enzyme n=1 Tax=Arthrobacter mobilis TaxID=2724944 RepID=A0A7X6HCD3_9MICC|nr:aminotransferase class V-fold PLP-dependent enzyme [Arthrobacter mobilis]NKX54514.1 aminotransferase class V-fold PLP-dependent enzyme [Arthrobacter mobilis]
MSTSILPAILPVPSPAADVPLLEVAGADLQVPLIRGGQVRLANLDYAASAPALVGVAEHLQDLLPYCASVHRGAGYTAQVSTAVYEKARHTIRRFVGGREDDQVIFTRNATDALNLLAGCVPDQTPGGEVLYLDIEHHANLLPWQRTAHRSLGVQPTIAGTLAAIEAELARGRTSLLAVTGASHVTGELFPVAEAARLARRYGARTAVDAAQLAAHRRIDIARDGIDYVVLSGSKLYAPFGAGALIGRGDWLDAGTAYLAGGGAVRRVRPETATWTTGPARHEAGSPNLMGVAALAKAAELLADLDPAVWLRQEQALRSYLAAGLESLPGIRVHRIFPEDEPGTVGIVNFSVAGYDAGLVAAYLSAEHGVGLRDGKFCAHPLLNRLGLPSGSLRASFGLGSRFDDAARLLTGLTELQHEGLRHDYVVECERWVPAAETRPFPDWAPAMPGTAGAAPAGI